MLWRKNSELTIPAWSRKLGKPWVVVISDRSFIALESVMTVQDEVGLYDLDDEEAEMLREAATDPRPRLRGTDVDDYLARRLNKLGRWTTS